MRKSLAPALLLAAAGPALAQTTPAPSSATAAAYQYCHLLGTGPQGRDASLEYGQHPKPLVANPELDALNEKVKNVGSVLLVLNYVTSYGWEYVAVTSVSPASNSYIVYVLRRPMPAGQQ